MTKPKKRTVYKAKYTGKVYNTAREAALDNRAYLNNAEYRYTVKSEKVKKPKTYEIPFIPSKKRTLTNAGLATGAVISENMLDSIAKYANQAGLPIKTALGLAVKESTLGNPTDDTSVYKILSPNMVKVFKELGTGQHINEGGDAIHPADLVNFHADINPYDATLMYAEKKATGKGQKVDYNKRDKLLIEGERYADSKVKEYEETYGNNNTLYNAFKYYKEHPDKYNPGQPNYQQLVNKRANEIWGSPEIQSWYRRSLEDGRNKKLKGGTVYTVQKGDTLSDIARLYAGDINRYLQIANANNINNPDLIEVGQKITIPEKFDKPLKFEDIPTNNRISVIDDFSPNYNYIIEGNKIYYSRKGHNDYWVDISDNDTARKNLFNHIASKYNYKGYEDDEKTIGEQVLSGTYDYKKAIKPKRRFSLEEANFEPADAIEQPSSVFTKRIDRNTTEVPREATTYLGDAITAITDLYQKGTNYVSRQYEKLFGDKDATSTLEMPKEVKTDSKYNIMPQSYTGDTINVDKNKYIIPESINLNDVRLGIRNRGSREPINTEGAIITNFNPYTPYNKVSKSDKTATYMGIDKDGNFKVGTIDKFSDGDMLTRTFANDVTSFAKDKKGNQIWKDDSAHGNKGRNVPVINVIENGKVKQGSLNILTDKGSSKSNTYGNITGGRVVLEAGNERRLVSGSIDDIEKQFNDLKTRHGVESVKIYTLDNGSYNRGLRTRNKKLTAKDLQAYDNQNRGGGNFMYLLNGNAFTTDTVTTPNIRTVNSESYKQGHPLTNEQKGVVLHHTAFEEDDLTNVTRHLTNPNTEASSHVIIGYNGHRRTLASPDKVTFHAGESVWNNRQNVNDFMLGIEFQGDTNKNDLTDSQIKSAIEYLRPIIRKNNIPLENIVTHEQVRAMYNDFAKRQGKRLAANKPDINQKNYTRIIDALLKSLYYPKRQLKYGGAVLSIN